MNKQEKLKLQKQLEIVHKKPIKIHNSYYSRRDKRTVVAITIGEKYTFKLLARLLLEIKVGRPLVGDETVDHIDENPSNDDPDNLQILSRAENSRKSADASKMVEYSRSEKGRLSSSERFRGDKNPMATISNEEAKRIRNEFLTVQFPEFSLFAEKQPIEVKSLRYLLTGCTYKEAGGPIFEFYSKIGRGSRPTWKQISPLPNTQATVIQHEV